MKVTQLPEVEPRAGRKVAIGTFDGVHLGHREVIRGANTVLTFDPHPLAIIARAAVALDQHGQRQRAVGPEGFRGLCLNIAALDGGVAFNVIPTEARLAVSLRPAPLAA